MLFLIVFELFFFEIFLVDNEYNDAECDCNDDSAVTCLRMMQHVAFLSYHDLITGILLQFYGAI